MILDYWSVRLVIVCTFVFLLQLAFPPLTDYLVLSSATFFSQPWTLVTSMFAHASFEHLFFNMFGLFLFGVLLENIIGGRRWLMVFFAAGILGGIAGLPLYQGTLGASGAIYGVMGALAVLRPRMVIYFSYVPLPMYLAVPLWAAGDLLGLFIPSGVANAAHLAGLAIGLVFGFFWKREFGEAASVRKKYDVDIPESKWREWEDRYLR